MEHRRQETNMETRYMVAPETQATVVNEEKRTIRGYGIVFNKESEVLRIGGRAFREIIRPEAVQGVDLGNMLSMHNHKSDRLLGNTRSGTMRAGIDDIGVWYETDLPDSPTGQDVLVSVSRRDTQGSSFQFDITENGDKWSVRNGMALREVVKFNGVYEMGPVSEPGYPDTTIAKASLRSLEALEVREDVEIPTQAEAMSEIIKCSTECIDECNEAIGCCTESADMADQFAMIDPANAGLYAQMKTDCQAVVAACKTAIATHTQIISGTNSQRTKDPIDIVIAGKQDFQAIADDELAFEQMQML